MDRFEKGKNKLMDLRMGLKRPPRSGEAWSKDELRQLKERFYEGVGLSELTILFGRTELAVVQKLKEMNAFEQQSRPRGPNRYPIPEPRCQCPFCSFTDCPNFGKELCHAGSI